MEGKHLNRYLEQHIRKWADMQENIRLAQYTPETLQKAGQNKVRVLNVKKLVK